MDGYEIRYMFEHQLLPQWFFEKKFNFIMVLLEDKEFLYKASSAIFEEFEVENPYSKEDFKVETAKMAEEVMVVKMIFPKPEKEPLCYSSYLFFDKEFKKVSYFCIERGDEEKCPFVCSWEPNGEHNNYGNCTFKNHNDFMSCADIHMEQKYGLRRKNGR